MSPVDAMEIRNHSQSIRRNSQRAFINLNLRVTSITHLSERKWKNNYARTCQIHQTMLPLESLIEFYADDAVNGKSNAKKSFEWKAVKLEVLAMEIVIKTERLNTKNFVMLTASQGGAKV